MSNADKLSISDTHIFDVCTRIEETCSKLYQYFSKLYADDPEACNLWDKTSKEEDNHAKQFQLAYRLQGSGVRSIKTNIKKANAVLAKIQFVYEAVQKSPPRYVDALQFAIKLEKFMADYHMDTIAVYNDESTARLFTAMMKCDQEHIKRLEKSLEIGVSATTVAADS